MEDEGDFSINPGPTSFPVGNASAPKKETRESNLVKNNLIAVKEHNFQTITTRDVSHVESFDVDKAIKSKVIEKIKKRKEIALQLDKTETPLKDVLKNLIEPDDGQNGPDAKTILERLNNKLNDTNLKPKMEKALLSIQRELNKIAKTDAEEEAPPLPITPSPEFIEKSTEDETDQTTVIKLTANEGSPQTNEAKQKWKSSLKKISVLWKNHFLGGLKHKVGGYLLDKWFDFHAERTKIPEDNNVTNSNLKTDLEKSDLNEIIQNNTTGVINHS